MNFLERINAVLHHQKPDKVPFAPSENLIPRGDFEREMRNRGMGLYAERATYWSETPNVRVESKRQVDGALTIYHTPAGSVSTGKNRRMIEDVDDYEPVIFMVNDTVFHADYSVYSNSVRDLGADGIVRGSGIEPPLEDIVRYIGAANLEKEQRAHPFASLEGRPEQFAKLLKALEQRTEKLLPLIEDSPSELIPVGEIGDAWTPEQFKKYILPFYQKYVPRLHEKGKLCSLRSPTASPYGALDVRTSKLKAFKDLIPQTGIDVVEGFTPPPIGDLSLEEARATWGKDIIIWLNFPETILLDGAEKTREYTINLLKSNATGGALVIGLTSMRPMTDEAMEHTFKEGLRAILDAVEYRAKGQEGKGAYVST